MDVGSVSSTYGSPSLQGVQRTPEAAEVQRKGGDNDGDADDIGGKAAQAAPKPTVNMNGQAIGQIINVAA